VGQIGGDVREVVGQAAADHLAVRERVDDVRVLVQAVEEVGQARPNGSTSGSGPASGSKRSLGTTSLIAPRRAPASSVWLTASSRTGMAVWGELPRRSR
jgi:hypothetical protein